MCAARDDDSAQAKREQFVTQTRRAPSSWSDSGDDDDIAEIIDDPPTSSISETHASTNRETTNKKKKTNDYQTSQTHFLDDNNVHQSQQDLIVYSQLSQPIRTEITSDEQPSSPSFFLPSITYEQYDQLSTIIDNTNFMDKFVQQNPLLSPPNSNPSGTDATNPPLSPLSPTTSTQTRPPPPKFGTSPRLSETSEVVVYPSSVSLRGLLSYQDVISAIEREFHLHEGQEREIIMKLWLKGQTMLSILQRYRHLLQDLNLDDQDFLGGMKRIREMVNFADRDVQYLREQITMLENQNRFLENEFQRQLDKIVIEKNEQISRLIHIIDQTCPPPTEYTEHISDVTHSSGAQDLLAHRFMNQNVELQRELETLRAKLEFTFTLLNDKLDQQSNSPTSSIIQEAIEQMRQSDAKLQELQFKSSSQQDENDLLRYLMDRSQNSNGDVTQLFSVIEQRSLEREISRVRHELEMTERKTAELEQRFETADETVKFNLERLRLKCDVLRQHIATCNERLDDVMKQGPVEFIDDSQLIKREQQFQDNARDVIRLENELLAIRERYNDLVEYSNTLKYELDNARKQLNERSLIERDTFDSSIGINNDTMDLENERRRSAQLQNELFSLKIKYEDVCERVTAATLQLERVQVVLEQTLRRCEQLEKEKSEINAQSEYLSQNVATVTAKYKDKMNTIKSRLEQTDRDRRDAQQRTEQLQNEIERLKNELTHKKEMIFEKDKLIQDAQYKSREILLERQTVEERISNEYKRLNELVDKNRLLEEELERMRRSQILENITVRRTDVINLDGATIESSGRLDELRNKINDFERRFITEKTNKESLQVQIKILEEENADLREIMSQMRKRAHDDRKDDRDRNDEIQQLIARAENNARQYMSNFNISTTTPPSTLVRIIPVSSPTKIS